MKGMASIGGDHSAVEAAKLFVEQPLDTEVIEDGFTLPKKHLRQAANQAATHKLLNSTAPLK